MSSIRPVAIVLAAITIVAGPVVVFADGDPVDPFAAADAYTVNEAGNFVRTDDTAMRTVDLPALTGNDVDLDVAVPDSTIAPVTSSQAAIPTDQGPMGRPAPLFASQPDDPASPASPDGPTDPASPDGPTDPARPAGDRTVTTAAAPAATTAPDSQTTPVPTAVPAPVADPATSPDVEPQAQTAAPPAPAAPVAVVLPAAPTPIDPPAGTINDVPGDSTVDVIEQADSAAADLAATSGPGPTATTATGVEPTAEVLAVQTGPVATDQLPHTGPGGLALLAGLAAVGALIGARRLTG